MACAKKQATIPRAVVFTVSSNDILCRIFGIHTHKETDSWRENRKKRKENHHRLDYCPVCKRTVVCLSGVITERWGVRVRRFSNSFRSNCSSVANCEPELFELLMADPLVGIKHIHTSLHPPSANSVMRAAILPLAFQVAILLLLCETAAKAQPRDELGEWGDVFDLTVIPIHAMLLPDAQVLLYGTDNRGEQGGGIYYEVWDWPKNLHHRAGTHKLLRHTTNVDIFCTTASMDVTTGNYLLIGGDEGENYGVRDVLEFDTQTLEIRKHPKGQMKYPRWYATSVGLPNGDVLVVGGKGATKRTTFESAVCELWSPSDGFRELPGTEVPFIKEKRGASWWYPIVAVNSSGDIVLIRGNGDNGEVYRLEVDGDGSIEKVGQKPFSMDELGPSVMFDVDQIMLIARDGALWVCDISDSSNPTFEERNSVGTGRTNAATNVLPDGRVIFTGGSTEDDDLGNELRWAVKHVTIWDPRANTIYEGPEEELARLYHSSGIILPDGTIYSGGGGAPGPLDNLNGNIYKPGYLFDPNTGEEAVRPVILRWPQNLEAGESFRITVDDANHVDQVTMTKPGTMTHSRNCDHRWLDLSYDVLTENEIEVRTPNRNVLIPGLWMVNILSDGVPSEGRLLGVNMAESNLYIPDGIDLSLTEQPPTPAPTTNKPTTSLPTLSPIEQPTGPRFFTGSPPTGQPVSLPSTPTVPAPSPWGSTSSIRWHNVTVTYHLND